MKTLNYIKKNLVLYLMLVFPITFYIIFHYIPMYGVIIAFKDYSVFRGISGSEWIGLEIFERIFSSKFFFLALRNTLMLNIVGLIVGFPIPILLAIILNEMRNEKFKKLTQTIIYLPHFLSWVIIGGISMLVFAPKGVINEMLVSMGFSAIPFLTKNVAWVVTYTGIGVWQGAGWGTIIYLAAISNIDQALYESAEIDGAGRIQRIWHITLQGIKPVISMLLILSIGNLVGSGFEKPFVLGNTLVRDVSEVIATYVYKIGLQSGQFSEATAVGLFQSVVGIILLISANKIAEKTGEQGIW